MPSLRKCGLYFRFYVVGASRPDKSEKALGRKVAIPVFIHECPHLFGKRRASNLARQKRFGSQCGLQFRKDRGLSRPFPPIKHDEFPPRHDAMVAQKDYTSAISASTFTLMSDFQSISLKRLSSVERYALISSYRDFVFASNLIVRYGPFCEYLITNITSFTSKRTPSPARSSSMIRASR